VLSLLETAQKNHVGLIKKVLKGRNNVFGHSNFHRPMYVGSGLPGSWVDFANYWRDLSEAAKAIEERIFPAGTNYGPQLTCTLLDEDIAGANKFFDQLIALGSS
jgi:hypothetical protein